MSNRLPEEVRIKACQLFSLGYGYKNVAKVLNLNVYTVRDWKRDYASMSRSSRTINPVGRRGSVSIFVSRVVFKGAANHGCPSCIGG